MRISAPAKVNLHLRVGPARADGFHPVLSWMTTIGLFDKLEFSPGQQGAIHLQCDPPELSAGADNLVWRAATRLRELGQRPEEIADQVLARGGVSIRLTKQIPVGAGLGGGSSDAARTLVALNHWWRLGLPKSRLAQLAGELGSDVAFFLDQPSAICSGRGEIVQPIAKPAVSWLVLISPPFGCSTPAVYRAFDQLRSAAPMDDPPDWVKWAKLNAAQLLPRLVNDLEPAAFVVQPELGQIHDRLQQHLGQIVRMSGSGSTLFTLFDTQNQAEQAASRIRTVQPDLKVQAVELCPRLDEPV
ncbi:MAG: 4-(cytidine 5'-diphospho)-2-C-methyl-D-erythritol kinase [Phycisphaerales bacterium]|nr:4-(cytidine 5'-diphospho)-2-C-methyl-D-erythritol kinase [Phycisphaerales bacterium]